MSEPNDDGASFIEYAKKRARRMLAGHGLAETIEIDDDISVEDISETDRGAWLPAWVFVHYDDEGNEE